MLTVLLFHPHASYDDGAEYGKKYIEQIEKLPFSIQVRVFFTPSQGQELIRDCNKRIQGHTIKADMVAPSSIPN